jgi:hypothetical protein
VSPPLDRFQRRPRFELRHVLAACALTLPIARPHLDAHLSHIRRAMFFSSAPTALAKNGSRAELRVAEPFLHQVE